MIANIKAPGFSRLKWMSAALFCVAHTEHMKMHVAEPKPANIPVGFRNLQGSNIRAEGIRIKRLSYNWSAGSDACLVIGSTKGLDVVPTMTRPL